jgi:opacity protein-like surface antigen
MKKLLITACAVVVAATMAQPASAQVHFGGQLNYADDADLGIGVRGQFDLGSMLNLEGGLETVTGAVSFDYFFQDCDPADCTYFEINANGLYPIEMEGSDFAPYAGGGLNIARASVEFTDAFGNTSSADDTEIGLNILGGANFAISGFDVFAEARLELGGGEQFVITFGTLFGGD